MLARIITRDGDRRASPPERSHIGLCFDGPANRACGAKAGKNASGESTKDIIEAVRLGVFTPPGVTLRSHSLVVFPLSMNNPGPSVSLKPVGMKFARGLVH